MFNKTNGIPNIVVLGGINMDLTATVSKFPEPGETIIGKKVFITPGGKGANQAVSAAKLGANVSMIGRVGDDTFAPTLLRNLQCSGVDIHGIYQAKNTSSGVAIILVDLEGQNKVVVIRGANMTCDESELQKTKQALEDANALMLQLEIPSQISISAAKFATEKGIPVILDPAPTQYLSQEILDNVDILTPNQTEAEYLTGIKVTDSNSAKMAAEAIFKLGVNTVVVKIGAIGAYYISNNEAGLIPSYQVDAVDSVAAGDAFGAALTVALCEGKCLKDAVIYGTASGALAVTKNGAQSAMPTRIELESFIRT
jgi:ribokinase